MVDENSHVVIVGHGPSLKGAGLGPRIDTFKWVVRLKNCSMLLAEPHDYGTKTDVMCSSTEVLPVIAKVKAKEYWGYPKKGTYVKSRVRWLSRHVEAGSSVIVPLEVCNLWNAFFREMGGKHPNVSTGMGAVICALHLKRPKKLYLAGFDNVLDPSIEGYNCTVPTHFNHGGTRSTGHDWLAENQLLSYLAAHFQTKILNLAGRHHVQTEELRDLREALH
jgi:hypothetical protein